MQVNNQAQLVDNILKLIQEQSGGQASQFLNGEFKDHLTQAILQSQQPEQLAETKNVSILLSDLRGFTAMAEKYSPLTVIELLNRYFGKMSQIIDKHNGVIDKFMGDSIMVLFGALGDQESDLHNPLACAIEMQMAMDEINQISDALGMANLYMGIGINTGEVVAGSLGSDIYREYTVIGDQVNLVSRLEAYSLRGQILLSENTYQQSKDFIEVGETNEVHVKGKGQAVMMHELLAVCDPLRLEVPRREIRKSPRVEVDIPLNFQQVESNKILTEVYEGRVIDISYGGLFAQTHAKIEQFSEIKMIVSLSLMGQGSSEIYARVLRCREIDQGYECHFEFTSIDEPARRAIKSYIDHLIMQVD